MAALPVSSCSARTTNAVVAGILPRRDALRDMGATGGEFPLHRRVRRSCSRRLPAKLRHERAFTRDGENTRGEVLPARGDVAERVSIEELASGSARCSPVLNLRTGLGP